MRHTLVLLTVVAAMAALLLAQSARPAHAAGRCSTTSGTTTCTFSPTGAEDSFVVPDGVSSVHVWATGAPGAVGRPNGGSAGRGAQVSGDLRVDPGQTLYANVGGAPTGVAQGADCYPDSNCIGGFNGGGTSRYGGGGGGASDVRTVARDQSGSLSSRLIVAGGGGGSGEGWFCAPSPSGGAGRAHRTGGGAGGQSAGGLGGSLQGQSGSLGLGGNGGGATGGGGGGGLYGGGGGGSLGFGEEDLVPAGGGGGGSNLVPTGGNATIATGGPSVTISYTLPDTTPPTLSVIHTADGSNGWNKTSPVTLNVSASDSGSGLAGAPTCTDGTTSLTLKASPTAGSWTASVSGEGTHNISCSVSDNATNPSGPMTDTVKIDTIAPSISDQGPTAQPHAAGWYNTDVTNTFKATDSSGSGLSAACLASFPLNAGGDNVQSNTTSGEGLTQKVTSDSCTDVAGNTATGINSANFKVDKTPIPSTASANNSNYSSPITVNYDASTDPADLSGLKKVELWAKGPGQSSYANVDQATAATGSFSYAVTQEGTYSFYTIAEDNAGNREVQPPSADAIVTFSPDSAAPSTTASANNTDNSTYLSGEWTNQNVTVSLSAADNTGGSGLKEIRYTTDGTDPSASSTLYSGPFTVSSTTTVKYRAYDNAGNVEAIKTFEVKIDKTAPSTSCSVTPSKLNPASNNHKLLTITAIVQVTDNTGGSGANGFTLVSVTSNQAGSGLGTGDVANDIQGWAFGTPDLSGQLRAERYGTERTYTLTYRGKDLAGNTTDCLATVRVPKGK